MEIYWWMPLHCIALMAIPYSMHISELGNTSVMWASFYAHISMHIAHIPVTLFCFRDFLCPAVDCDYQHCIVMQGSSIPRCISHCSHCRVMHHLTSHYTHRTIMDTIADESSIDNTHNLGQDRDNQVGKWQRTDHDQWSAVQSDNWLRFVSHRLTLWWMCCFVMVCSAAFCISSVVWTWGSCV